MHSCHYDDLFFTSHYINGLKDEIRAVVEPQMPTTVKKAATIAKIQQKVVDRSKVKYQRNKNINKPNITYKTDAQPTQPVGILWRDQQLRDYCKANGLCYTCEEKFDPGHSVVCSKKVKTIVMLWSSMNWTGNLVMRC